MTTPRQKAYTLANQRGMSISENREDRGITVRIEAPLGCNFSGDHELSIHYFSGSPWGEVIDSINTAVFSKCDDGSCGSWIDGACEWWKTDIDDMNQRTEETQRQDDYDSASEGHP